MTELAKYDQPQPAGSLSVALDSEASRSLWLWCDNVSKSSLVPDSLRGKTADVFLTIMTGLDFGFKPTQAFNLIYIVKGKPSLSAEGMRAQLIANGHGFRIVEATAEKAVVEGCRKGSDVWHRAEFTRVQAKNAKLSGANWDAYPDDMLIARASTRLCKRFFPDVTNGLPSAEELFDEMASSPDRPSLAAVAADRGKTQAAPEPATADPDVMRAEIAAIEAEHAADAVVVEDPPDNVMWPEVVAPGSAR
jgi:hypothetical protein